MKPHNFFIIKDELEDGEEAYLDITTLENDIAEIRPELIILDPIQSYLPEDTNINSANEIRRVMDNIAALAKKYDTTFLLIMHPNKMTSVNDPLDRMLGSSDFRNAARSVLVVGFDPEDKERRAMVMQNHL